MTDRALPGRQLRLRLRLGGRRRPARRAPGAARPRLAARSRPTSSALDEFMRWAHKAGVEPMMAVNLGTRGVDEAARPPRVLQPSRRHRTGPTCARATASRSPRHQAVVPRQRDGRPLADRPEDRRGVRPARRRDRQGDEAGRPDDRAGRLRQLEPRACRPSAPGRRRCSSILRRRRLHLAARLLRAGRATTSTASSQLRATWTRFIETVVATCDHVRRDVRSDRKRINLSFDEWNVWYQSQPATAAAGDWAERAAAARGRLHRRRCARGRQHADHLLRHADRVRSPAWRSSSTSSRRS